MADNHLWFSIFAYHMPSANRFTRIQRCTCCFVLFFMSLLMNLIYYPAGQEANESKNEDFGVTIGPFCFSKEAVIMFGLSFHFIFSQ